MGVEQQVLRLAVLQLFDDGLHLDQVGGVLAQAVETAIVDVQVMQVDRFLGRSLQRQACSAAVGHIAGGGVGDTMVDRNPQLRDPDVPDVGLEICVAPQRHPRV
ncbi:hypothetical protein D9M68_919080 [compost metagenome]